MQVQAKQVGIALAGIAMGFVLGTRMVAKAQTGESLAVLHVQRLEIGPEGQKPGIILEDGNGQPSVRLVDKKARYSLGRN